MEIVFRYLDELLEKKSEQLINYNKLLFKRKIIITFFRFNGILLSRQFKRPSLEF